MHQTLRIEGDPVSWGLDGDPDAVAEQLAQAAGPVALPVVSPLRGRLILAPRALGSLALLDSPSRPGGWVPTHRDVPVPCLYVPTAGGLAGDFSGYQLTAGTDLDALEKDVIATIRAGGVLKVPADDGVVLLYGASIRLVALALVTG